MAAFSSVVALEQLLNQLSNSDQLPHEELVPLRQHISSLKSSLENIFPAPKKERDEANILAEEIRNKIFKAQDEIESFIYTQSQQSESPESSTGQSKSSIALEEITSNMNSIVAEAKKLGDSIAESRKHIKPVNESETYKASESTKKAKIVGQEKYKAAIEKKLISSKGSRLVIPISGMPGIGKTTLARSIYEDDKFMSNFPYKAWVTVSQDANIQEILGKLLHSVESRGQKAGDKKYEGDEAKLRVDLHQALSNNKYLVVVDDMWDMDVWMRLKTALPDNENSSRILLTTRSLKLAEEVKSVDGVKMEPLNDEDSWTLLCNRTFGDDNPCPANLETVGRLISKHCKGLPLSLTVIGGLLSQGSKEPEYWQTIEEDTSEATSKVAVEDAYLQILSLSYDYLPSKLKGCFLYMGAFPEDSDIPVSKVIRLWVAEGFLTKLPRKSQLVDKVAELSLAEVKEPPIEEAANQSLKDLIDRNLVLIRKHRSNGLIRTCGMHDSLKDLAENKSIEDYFFHSRRRYSQKLDDKKDDQRRVSVHKNILMCLEDVYNATKTIGKARSLLYVGPHHHHPMPFSLTFDLLRVLDAFTVYFIRFPDEFLKLVHLRYLSFTYNGKLPSKIAELHKLEVLIVKRQPKIIFVGMPFLPDEIWGMKQLRHLLMTETDLPILPPTESGAILFQNLQTLTNVNADSGAEAVLEHAPNLKRLGMWMEGPKKTVFEINKLDQLVVFKFTVLNPKLKPTPDIQPKFYFPNIVVKLNLSGTGLPWKDMEEIAKLPNLQVLKLKELAFHGDDWCPDYDFKKLKFLLIEYLNLQNWETDSSRFPCLEQLILRHCYDLEVFPTYIEERVNLQLLELVDCSPDAVDWAEKIKATVEDFGNSKLKVKIYSSWE